MTSSMNSSPPPLRGRSDRQRVRPEVAGPMTSSAVREGGQQAAHHHAVPDIRRGRAKSLRRGMTEAEKRLWYWLRAHRFAGIAFRRQTPIGPFIVDFVSHECRLVIELDGGQHSGSKRDVWRERWLRSKGYRVLRIWNSDVMSNRDGVLEVISATIARNGPPSRRSRTTSEIGDLPLKGGGEKGGGGRMSGPERGRSKT